MKDNSLENLKIASFKKELHTDGVLNLHTEAMSSTGENIPPSRFDDLKNIEAHYLEKGGEFLVGTIDGEVVAMGGIKRVSENVAELKRMRTKPQFQRRGFAQAILERLEERARELGFNCIELDTSVGKKGARALYENNKYEKFKEEVVDGIPCVFYSKILT